MEQSSFQERRPVGGRVQIGGRKSAGTGTPCPGSGRWRAEAKPCNGARTKCRVAMKSLDLYRGIFGIIEPTWSSCPDGVCEPSPIPGY